MAKSIDNIDTAKIGKTIELLKQYVNDPSIEPLISSLEALKNDPDNETLLAAVNDTFSALGIVQGAILTYAPYVSSLLTGDLFGGR
jgi:hypothetical protein